jgi:ABC-type branched-subunit amino acid transport system substrate-binding protein
MLYKFKSRSAPDLIMLEPHGRQILQIIGKTPGPTGIITADVVKKFRDAKVEPEGYVMYAYAAMQLFAQAAEQAKSVKYADLEKAMRGGSFDTVIGKLSFDAKGDNKLPGFMVYQWKGGQYDYVKK